MKTKFILFAISTAFLFCSHTTVAQTNNSLQFSKAIVYDLAADSSKTFTVPAGKIWKIESVSMGSSGSVPGVFLKNAGGQNIAFFASPASTASANYPYWLPEAFSGTFLNNSHSYHSSVSITEYSNVP